MIVNCKTEGYAFQMEMMVEAERRQLRIEEEEIIFVDRFFGRSKLGAVEVLRYLKVLMKLYWEE